MRRTSSSEKLSSFCFFFSSRRRHTRCLSDWSSDVCSSDLLKYHPFGITPYLGAGGGTIRFKPTPYGGQGLPFQYRAAYYYQLGLEDNFPGSHFGMRLGFRQLIYLAPDFLQNYLTITRRTRTSEPTIGLDRKSC